MAGDLRSQSEPKITLLVCDWSITSARIAAAKISVDTDAITISQRTVVRMVEAIDLLEIQKALRNPNHPSAVQISDRRRIEFWIDRLYENDFPDWFINRAEEFSFDFRTLLRSVQSGRFFFPTGWHGNITGQEGLSKAEGEQLGQIMIGRMAAILVCLTNPEPVRLSLERDGYAVDCNRKELTPLEGPVKIQEEDDRFRSLIRAVRFPHQIEILKHLTDATDLYTEIGKEHPCLNECRSFLQSLVDDISEETNRFGGHSVGLPGGTANRFDYLRDVRFFKTDEHAAMGSAWGTLCAGSHPGVPARDSTRIGLILAIEFGQLLVLKFTAWSAKECKSF